MTPLRSNSVSQSTLELLAWVAAGPRTYAEAMEAWRSTCPRLSVWDDAINDGLVMVEPGSTLAQSAVALTPLGAALLDGRN